MLINDIITIYSRVARPIMRRHWSADSCIGATRVTQNILAVFGIPVRPLAVKLSIFNEKFVKRVHAEGWPKQPEMPEAWKAEGCWGVGVGHTGLRNEPVEPGKWDGHLVALACENTLIDAAVDQAARPQYDIPTPDVLVAPVTPEFLAAQRNLTGGMTEDESGPLFVYEVNLAPPPFHETPDWVAVDNKHGLVEIGILRAMQQRGVPLEPAEVLSRWKRETQRTKPRVRR